ncbi:hypothetical protein EC991_002384 [Linnemannia zychae]|nr:hypothetical protein EC991_002384 [Linnemannia zychae]
MENSESDLNYGSTLSFSLVCSVFDVSETAPSIQTKSRTFDRVPANLNQDGCWHCVFTETKKKHKPCIELTLSLNWMSAHISPASSSQQGAASNTRAFISRIQSIKMRSDSTLSEILVDRLDGRRIFEGDSIQASETLHEPISINAHSSALGESQYFAQRLTEITEGKATRGSPFYGVLCNITEFTPPVFRVMLRFLYMGRLRFKRRDEKARGRVATRTGQSEKESTEISGVCSFGVFETEERRAKHQNEHGAVDFRDIYRISERYQIPALKALSLKAMRCALSMSMAISMLVKCHPENGEDKGESDRDPETALNKLQWTLAKDSVKEYIRFYGTEVTTSADETLINKDMSVDTVNFLGDAILNNLYRFCE